MAMRSKSISGCSIGALIGGVYAAGKVGRIRRIGSQYRPIRYDYAVGLSWRQSSGMFKGDKIIDSLRQLIGELLLKSCLFLIPPLLLMSLKKRGLADPVLCLMPFALSLCHCSSPHVINGEELIDGELAILYRCTNLRRQHRCHDWLWT